MNDGIVFALTLVTALGCGLVAGVFFAFSSFVMKGLHRLPSAQGVAAMQAINTAAVSPAFMAALFGTAAACAASAVVSLVRSQQPAAGLLLAGSGVYLVGVIVLTVVYHVPRNNALAAVEPGDPDTVTRWTRYVARWTAWNHVRSVAALAAALAFTVALRIG